MIHHFFRTASMVFSVTYVLLFAGCDQGSDSPTLPTSPTPAAAQVTSEPPAPPVIPIKEIDDTPIEHKWFNKLVSDLRNDDFESLYRSSQAVKVAREKIKAKELAFAIEDKLNKHYEKCKNEFEQFPRQENRGGATLFLNPYSNLGEMVNFKSKLEIVDVRRDGYDKIDVYARFTFSDIEDSPFCIVEYRDPNPGYNTNMDGHLKSRVIRVPFTGDGFFLSDSFNSIQAITEYDEIWDNVANEILFIKLTSDQVVIGCTNAEQALGGTVYFDDHAVNIKKTNAPRPPLNGFLTDFNPRWSKRPDIGKMKSIPIRGIVNWKDGGRKEVKCVIKGLEKQTYFHESLRHEDRWKDYNVISQFREMTYRLGGFFNTGAAAGPQSKIQSAIHAVATAAIDDAADSTMPGSQEEPKHKSTDESVVLPQEPSDTEKATPLIKGKETESNSKHDAVPDEAKDTVKQADVIDARLPASKAQQALLSIVCPGGHMSGFGFGAKVRWYYFPNKKAGVHLQSQSAPEGATSTRDAIHAGVDIGAQQGSVIFPIYDGKVVDVIDNTNDRNYLSLGYMAIVQHNRVEGKYTAYSMYLHLAGPPEVRVGQGVTRGTTMLGRVGTSGSGTGAHLHLEIRSFPSRFFERWGNIYGFTAPPSVARYEEGDLERFWMDPAQFAQIVPNDEAEAPPSAASKLLKTGIGILLNKARRR